MVTVSDARFMERALFLAERGRGTTSPNPVVGAVVVSPDGIVVGQGAHLRAGGPHAEIVALEMAGARARGATLYCTLEPCSHVGRTGPCVERIVPAGIKRVVAAMRDPNPRVAGAGFAHLRENGIDVEVGLEAAAARHANVAFLTWVSHRRPHVTLKTAVTADGFVGRAGQPMRLTGRVADRHFQRERAAIDAIAVGADTVIADDPLLTPREVWRERPLTRLVFDWRLRVSPKARLFSTLQAGPVIMAVDRAAADERPESANALTRAGARIETFANRDLGAVLDWLGAADVTSLVVEGGPVLQQAFADARLADRVQWIETPASIRSGVAAAPALAAMRRDAAHARLTRLGPDQLVEWDVHRSD